MGAPGWAEIPLNPRDLRHPVRYAELEQYLGKADALPHVTVTREMQTSAGRSVFLVHLDRGGDPARKWRVLFVGQQHGDEPAGKDALAVLIRQIAERPELLPRDVSLWVMPMSNPDGAEADKRRNGAGADLNRDHALLEQPETRAIHAVARRVMPHVAVDCHEFSRDSRDYANKGWSEWPLIMMDTANHPLYSDEVYRAGVRRVEGAAPLMRRLGFNYTRYYLGDAPPDTEWRHSTLEPDDARNGIGAYGGLSFIIESGVTRGAADPDADLGLRAAAYHALLKRFLVSNAADAAAIARARRAPAPDFLPVNTFWGSAGGLKTDVARVIEIATSRTLEIPTANFHRDRIVKAAVPAPAAYAVDAAAAPAFRELLSRHAIACEVLTAPLSLRAEKATLVRVEDKADPVYERYAGRAIVERAAPAPREFAAGTLLVRLAGPDARRAALLLEPCQLYGLYPYPAYRKLVAPDGTMPVWRVVR
jgi:hypothetical protein